MKNHQSLKRIIAASVLSLCLAMAAAGCGSSNQSSGQKASDQDTTVSSAESEKESENSLSDQDSTEDSAQPESSAAEESSEVSQVKILDMEKDIQINTLSVKEMPFNKNLFSSDFEGNDTLTVITYLAESELLDDFIGEDIERFDDKKPYDFDADKRLFLNWLYNVKDKDDYRQAGFYGVIVTAGNAKPSDYYFYFKYDGNEYKVPLSDQFVDVPAEHYTDDEAKVCNIINLDGEPYFIAGFENGTNGGGTLEGEKHHTSYIELPMSLRRIHADGSTRLDISKFSYEADEDIAATNDTSKITVTIEEESKYNSFDRQCIKLKFEYEYDEGQYTDDELDELETTMERMSNFGYLVYNGEKNKVRIDL